MGKYYLIDKDLFTEAYLTAVKIILEKAGCRIEENKEDLKIFIPEEHTLAWALAVFKDCHLM